MCSHFSKGFTPPVMVTTTTMQVQKSLCSFWYLLLYDTRFLSVVPVAMLGVAGASTIYHMFVLPSSCCSPTTHWDCPGSPGHLSSNLHDLTNITQDPPGMPRPPQGSPP